MILSTESLNFLTTLPSQLCDIGQNRGDGMKRYMLQELCSIITDGTHQTPTYTDKKSGVIFLSSKDVTQEKIDWQHVKYIPQDLHEKLYARLAPQRNDILLAKNGTTGIAALVDTDAVFDIYVSLALLRPKKIIYPPYLLSAINSPATRRQFDWGLKGIGVPNLHLNVIQKTEIPVPDYEEQKRIAGFFQKIDGIISNRQRVLTLLDELVKSRFVEMFGDPVLNPKKWERHQLNDDIIFLTSGSRGWSKYFSRDGEIFITIKNVKNGRITLDDVQYVHAPDNAEAKRTKVQAGDLLISITADLGRTGVVSEALAKRGAYINQHLTCIRLNRNVINPEYTAMFMESAGGKCQFDAKNQVGVKAGLNFEAIKGLEIMVPPLSLQNQFSTFVHQVEATKTSVRTQLTALTTLRAKMMQEFFG